MTRASKYLPHQGQRERDRRLRRGEGLGFTHAELYGLLRYRRRLTEAFDQLTAATTDFMEATRDAPDAPWRRYEP